jgi:hypothetical protein
MTNSTIFVVSIIALLTIYLGGRALRLLLKGFLLFNIPEYGDESMLSSVKQEGDLIQIPNGHDRSAEREERWHSKRF